MAIYGSEIWGYFPASKWEKQINKYISKETDSLITEKLHTKFCTYALGVRTKSSNIACRGVLGSFPFLYNILINLIKYWCYLVKENKSNKLLISALNLASDMEKKNKDSWLSCIRLIFKYLELENLYKNYTNISTNKIMQIVKKKLSKIFIDQWKESLNSETNKQGNMGNKLRTYRKLKNLFKFEEYLQFGSKTEQQTYTKCRISANDLRIERGRYEGLKVEDRICNTSNLNIEDEFHFLMTCSPLDNCRAKYFNIIKRLYTNFENLSTEDKFIWLLSCEDKEIILLTSKLLIDLFKERKQRIT